MLIRRKIAAGFPFSFLPKQLPCVPFDPLASGYWLGPRKSQPVCVLCDLCWLHLSLELPPRLPMMVRLNATGPSCHQTVVWLPFWLFFNFMGDRLYGKSHIFLWILSKEEMWVNQCLLKKRGNPRLKPLPLTFVLTSLCKKGLFAPFWPWVSVQPPAELLAGAAVRDRLCRLPLPPCTYRELGKAMTEADNSKSLGWVGISLAEITLVPSRSVSRVHFMDEQPWLL